MKKLLVGLMIVSGITAAHAEVTGNLGLTTDYRFRGISQTQNAPAIQGGVDYTHSSGLYIGNWNSSVSSQLYPGSSGAENDLYAGFKKQFGRVTVDVGALGYFYPQTTTKTDTTELYVGVGYGPVSAKYSQSLTDYFGIANSKNSSYTQADLAYPIIGKLSAVAHVGRTNVNNSSSLNYTDYNAGLSYDFQGWTLAAKYYTNNSTGSGFQSTNTVNGQRLYKDAGVFSVSKAF